MFRAVLAALLLAFSLGAAAGPLDGDFQRLERGLHLKPVQKAQYDIAVDATKRAFLAVAMATMQIQQRVQAELEKPRPDLNILYDINAQVFEQNAPLFEEARREWTTLYGMLDARQVTIVKRFLAERLQSLMGSDSN